MLLLDGAVVGTEVIVVGERGTVLRSADRAVTWQAVPRATPATLTGIAFAPGADGSAARGWAVGHDGVILGTKDTGRTWAVEFRTDNLQDSFLDVVALSPLHAVAVGAYGLFAETKDGGRTWTRRKIGEDDFHFNRIARGPAGTLYLAGERATLLRSSDDGANWSALTTGATGSFFGVLPLAPGILLAHGLRGQVFRTTDDGKTWTASATPQPALLATALLLKNASILVAGGAGALSLSPDGGITFNAVAGAPTKAIAALLELPDGSVLTLGEGGANRLEPTRLVAASPAAAARPPAPR